MIRVCVFDLDGTLVNTIPALKRSADLTLGEFGFPPLTDDDVKQFVGNGAAMYVRRAFRKNGVEDEETIKKAFRRYMELFSENCLYENRPYPGIVELLERLRDSGIRMAVLSNKPQAETERTIRNAFPEGTFDRVTGAVDGVPLKPDPESLRNLLKDLGAAPEECLYFGDTGTDMETGVRADAHTIGVLWGFRGEEELMRWSPERIISHPKEIMDDLSAYLV